MGACGQAGAPTPGKAQVINVERGGPLHVNDGSEISLTVPQAAAAPRGAIADLPAALKVLWTIWLAGVAINLIVWVLVSGTAGDLIYPWPVWVAGPAGAALLAVSAGAAAIRRGRRPAAQLPPGGKG